MRLILCVVLLAGACKKDEPTKSGPVGWQQPAATGSGSAPRLPPPKSRIEQVVPPLDIKTPPADAVTTPSGLIYKKLATNDFGEQPKRNDTVLIQFTGWSQSTGETFNTTKGRNQPQGLPLNNAAPGFVEGLQLMKTGEKAVLWVPPAMGYVRPPTGTPETLVYEVELVEIQRAPEIPADVATPPANAITLPSGTKLVVLKAGEGAKARTFDTLTFTQTGWDPTGRMIEHTKRPKQEPVYKQSVAMEEVLVTAQKGAKLRLWWTSKDPKSPGQQCYEIEVTDLKKGNEPPSVPVDVAAPPADALKTPKGVAYKVLKPTTDKAAKKPAPTDRVKVHYTGWTTDGRMFDSSIVKNEPGEFSLNGGVIAGWTEGIPMFAIGDKGRIWVPDTLAYKGQQGRPQGMLVFDVEVLEIKPAPPPKSPHGGHGGDDDGHGH